MRYLLLGAALLLTLPATAQEARQGSLLIDHPWARATAPRQTTGAVYLVIRNDGDRPDRLLSVKGDIAPTIEMHANLIDAQGVNRMRELDAIQVPAKGATALEPSGLHIMLVQLAHPLTAGQSFPLSLVFEKAGEVKVEVEVQKASASAPMAGHGG